MNIVLVAEEAAGARALRAVAQSPHRLVAVFTGGGSGARASGRVGEMAQELGIPTYGSALVRDPAFPDLSRRLGVDVLLNVHSLFLIPGEALQSVAFGSFNLHPGPLPEYAGINTVSWALWEGASDYGVTLHWMEPRVDAGDIAYARRFPIPTEATALTLMGRCVEEGIEALTVLLEQLSADPGGVPRTLQDLGQRRYFARTLRPETRIEWSLPSRRVVGRVRACDYGPFPSPWGRAGARLGSLDVVVHRIEPTSLPCHAAPGALGDPCGGGVLVATADEWVCVETVEHEGRRLPAARLLDL